MDAVFDSKRGWKERDCDSTMGSRLRGVTSEEECVCVVSVCGCVCLNATVTSLLSRVSGCVNVSMYVAVLYVYVDMWACDGIADGWGWSWGCMGAVLFCSLSGCSSEMYDAVRGVEARRHCRLPASPAWPAHCVRCCTALSPSSHCSAQTGCSLPPAWAGGEGTALLRRAAHSAGPALCIQAVNEGRPSTSLHGQLVPLSAGGLSEQAQAMSGRKVH